MGSVLEPNTNAKGYFGCHIYCAQLCLRVFAIVTASCAVSNREFRYPLVQVVDQDT